MLSSARSWPLSKAQELFLWYSRSASGIPARFNHLPMVITLRGPLDVPAFRRACDAMIERHAAFRTIFTDGSEPRQTAGPAEPYTLPAFDLRHLTPERQALERERLLREAAATPFDLFAAPAWRALLIRLADDHHDFCAVAHHIIFDAWSQKVTLTELAEIYRAQCEGGAPQLAPLDATIFDFAVAEQEKLASGALESQIRYWLDESRGAPAGFDIPADMTPGQTAGFPGRVQRFAVPAPLLSAIEALAASRGVTPFSVLFAGFFAWLHQVTRQTDLWASVPVANRARREWKGIIGCVAQQIRPRIDVADDPSFGELIDRAQLAMRRGLRRQEVPFTVLDERHGGGAGALVTGSDPRGPFHASFAYQNALLSRIDAAGVAFDIEVLWDLLGVARQPVIWQFSQTAGGLDGYLEYRTDLFTPETAARWIADLLRLLGDGIADPQARLSALASPETRAAAVQALVPAPTSNGAAEPIAIVGIGCRFPGASGPEAFWQLLQSGGDAITPIPAERWSLERFQSADPSRPGKTYADQGGFIHDFDHFDATFFGISPREAAQMEPQQRLALELAWEAIEDAGLPIERLAGAPVGVFMATGMPDFISITNDRDALAGIDSHSASGLSPSIISNRISYTFDLRGPSVSLDTACSGSLVAVHQACQAIWHSGCSLALAGGVQINVMPTTFIMYSKATMLSPSGRCRAFDAGADGFVRGEGGGVVVLKPLSAAERDGDRVYAVIRGAAVNQDGRTPSLTMPSGDAQVMAIRAALADARLDGDRVQYVEAHGPGTQVGDPIEARALGAALSLRRTEPCIIGSVKTNIGHLEAAAGVAGVIKLALALFHKQIPPNLHFRTPNPKIDMQELRLRVPTALEAWPENSGGAPRIGSVNSFGFGGTNAHAVLAEAPAAAPPPDADPRADERAELLVLSARSDAALAETARAFVPYLDQARAPLRDIAGSAALRRSHHPYRLAAAGGSTEEWRDLLTAFAAGESRRGLVSGRITERAGQRRPVFVFSGMGQQHARMGRELFGGEPVFRAAIEACDRELQPLLGWSVASLLADGTAGIDRTEIAQAAIFSVQVALAALWRSWGIEPEAVVGHSVGEVAAAHVAGALTLADAARVVWARSTLQAETAGHGGMMAVGLAPDVLRAQFPFDEACVAVAAINGPQSTTLAGDETELQRLAARLTDAGVFNRRLKVEVPYHSPAMDPLMPRLVAMLAGIRPRPASIRLVSTVTGQSLSGPELTGSYWAENMRAPVRFADAIRALQDDGSYAFVEIAAHPVLSTSLRESLGAGATIVASLRRDQPERASLLVAAGALHVSGLPIDWSRLYGAGGPPLRLPHYPWQRTRHWHEHDVIGRFRLGDAVHPLLGAPLHLPQPAWKGSIDTDRAPFLRDHQIRGDTIFPMTGYHEMAVAAARELFGTRPCRVTAVRIDKALMLDEHAPAAIYLSVAADRTRFSIASASGDDFYEHFAGRFDGVPDVPPPLDLDAIRARCGERVDGAEIYRRLRQRGYAYGPAFQGVRAGWFGDTEALFAVEWPEALAADEAFIAHPAVEDGFLNAATLLAGDTLWIPTGAGELSAFAPPPRRGWSYARVTQRSDTAFTATLQIIDETGRCTTICRDLQYRAIDAPQARTAPRDLTYRTIWEPQPLTTAAAARAGERWLILADEDGVGQRLAQRVTATGGDAVLMRRGDTRPPLDSITTVVHLWNVDHSGDGNPLTQQADGTLAIVQLVQALERQPQPAHLVVVTRGACRVVPTDMPAAASHASWGLSRTIANEYPAMHCRLIDIDAAGADDDERLWREIASDDAELEVAFRGDARWLPRLQTVAMNRPAGAAPYQLVIREPGSIDHLLFAGMDEPRPGAGEIVVAVAAAGVNFKDIVKTLGLIDRDTLKKTKSDQALGGECAGRVVAIGSGVTAFQVGDEVIALASGCFATFAVASAGFAVHKPAHLTFEEAATLPVAYLTAYFALVGCARVRTGERILIHSATGGVGQAALRIAQQLGVEVFATAGSDEKRALLHSQGVGCVMNSRSHAFAGETLAATGGQGVDVVLNTLPASTLPSSLATLRPRGRLIDISNIYSDAAVDLRDFQKGLSVTAFDLDQLMRTNADDISREFRDAMAFVAEHQLPALAHRAYPLEHAEDAFRVMAQAQHIGKLVLVAATDAGVRVDVSESAGPRLDADSTYLVTGGTSGFGLFTAGWLVERGARHVALLSRRGATDAADEGFVATLRAQGADVQLLRADVSDAADLARALRELDTAMPPLRGIVHAATVYLDGVLSNVDEAALTRVLGPKAAGAWHLHQLTKSRPLDFFVMYSSVAGLLGSPGQAAYAAANAFLDGLAEQRQALGLPATSIAWGPLALGEAARRDGLAARFEESGLPLVRPADAVRAMGVVLELGLATAAVMDIRWDKRQRLAPSPRFSRFGSAGSGGEQVRSIAERIAAAAEDTRAALVADELAQAVAAILAIPAASLDREAALTNLGLDSLMAVELSNRLRQEFTVDVSSVRLLSGPSIAALSAQLVPQLLAATPGAAAPPAAARAAAPAARSGPLPLSFQQLPMWSLVRQTPNHSFFNLPAAIRLKGPLQAPAFTRAIARLVERHDTLRARFEDSPGGPVQIAQAPGEFATPIEDASWVDAADRDAFVAERSRAFALEGFDAAADPVIRTWLLRLAPDDHALLLVVHHLAADGASMPLLMRDGLMLYAAVLAGAEAAVPPPGFHYADFVGWQRTELGEARRGALIDHWRTALDGRIPALPLALDFPRPAVPSYRGATAPFAIDPGVSDQLRALGRAEQCTTFMTLLGALALFVHRATGVDDFCLGTFVANRAPSETRDVVGCFINQLALRVDLRGNPSMRDALGRVRATTLAAQEHAALPFSLLAGAIETGLTAPQPAIQIVLIFHNELGSLARFGVAMPGGLQAEFVECHNAGAKRDWTFHVYEEEGALSGYLEYDTDLFTPETARTIVAGYLDAISQVATAPDQRVGSMSAEAV